MAKLLSGTRIYGNATVDTSITVGTNVAAANVVITNASRLGTVTSGTWNGSSISTTYTDAKVTTVAGQTGAISNAQLASAVSTSGILTTANVTEVTNLYFTNARSRTSISTTGTKGSYNNSTGVFDFANIANVNVTASAPSSPNIGDQWIDNATAKTFIYFNDGTSSQWVEQASTFISTLVESVGGSTGVISNTMIASAVSGQNLGTPSAIVLTNASGTANNLTANIANFINVTDDTSTNVTRYIIFANGTSGAITEQVSSSKLTFNPSTGLLTSTDYNSSSDKRLKKNIKTMTSALNTVNALRGVTFEWKEGNGKAIGLIAQEVKEVLPEIVSTDDNGYLGIKYTNMIGVLVEAIKELKSEFEEYKKTHP